MYIRTWVQGKDDPYLIDIAVQNFDVRARLIQNILNQSNEVLIVCNDNDKIIGFLCYRFRIYDVVLVDYVVLDSDYQGKGVARNLLPTFEKHLMKKGIRTLYGTVDKDNHEALESFKRLGFQINGGILSRIIIEKKLGRKKSKYNPDSSYFRKLGAPPPLR